MASFWVASIDPKNYAKSYLKSLTIVISACILLGALEYPDKTSGQLRKQVILLPYGLLAVRNELKLFNQFGRVRGFLGGPHPSLPRGAEHASGQ
jgi:hypothetical protein